MQMNMNDPVVIIDGAYKGRLAYYKYPYPYPEGDPINPKSTLIVASSSFSEVCELILTDDQFIPIVNSAENVEDASNDESLLPHEQKHKFYESNRVLIKYGEYRGSIVKVIKVIPKAHGRLYDYEVGPVVDTRNHIDINITVPEEYLEFWNRENPSVTIGGVKIDSILKHDTMVNIATDIYSEVVRDHIEKVIKGRTMGGVCMADFILSHVANKIIEETCDEFRRDVVNRARQIIHGEATTDACEWFDQSLESSLINAIQRYIDQHTDDIIAIVKDRINTVASSKADDIIAKALYRTIDFKDILAKIINKIE